MKLRALGRHAEANEILHHGKIISRKSNLIMTSLNIGYDILVQFMISGYVGSFAFPLGPQWCEIGTGTTAPTAIDTALQAPTNRAPVSYAQDISYSQASLQFYYPDGVLTDGTYTECGTFLGGTSTIGTGNIFNHALFTNPYVKATGVDTTIEVDFLFGTAAEFDSGEFG